MNSLGFNKKKSETKVIVAMSGGIDSSVAAVLMKNEGYDVTGVTLRLYSHLNKNSPKSCCAGKDIGDAKNVANQYGFSHHVYDYQEQFYNGVIDDFVESYSNGSTPIPCIRCNQTVKFTDLLNAAKEQKADALVTGHYVRRIGGLKDARLHKAIDTKKDQSYFLFATTKEQLEFLRFPIGEYLKSDIRKMAQKFSLHVQDKPDSQDICFVTENSYRSFINKLKPESFIKGKIIDVNGKIIGDHEGIVNYTIGQRKGIRLGGYKEPLYVININKEKNLITLGEKKYLEKNIVTLKDINWLDNNIKKNMRCLARIRSSQIEKPGKLEINKNGIKFTFDENINATSPGQACVFYLKDQVLGGGWIT